MNRSADLGPNPIMNISQLSEQPVKLAVAGSPEAEAVGLREQSPLNQAEEGANRFVSPWGFVLSARAVHDAVGKQCGPN